MIKTKALRQAKPRVFYTCFLFMLSLLFSYQDSSAQRNTNLVQYLENPVLNESQQHYAQVLIKDKYTDAYWFIKLNQEVFKGTELSVLLPGNKEIKATLSYTEDGFGNTHSWFGKMEEGLGDVVFTIHDKMVTARLAGSFGNYMIYPLKGDMHILLRLNSQDYPHDETDEGYRNMLEQGKKDEGGNYESGPDPDGNGNESQLAGACKVRVLVAFTDDVQAALADPLGFCKSAIDVTNLCYNNSLISYNVELACAVETNYAESGNSGTDKVRFRETADGFMDDIHSWRTYYDADLCHLLVNNLTNGCGEAYTVSVSSYANAFCVTDRGCAVGNLTFPHEMGHLYGARHDTYVDNTNTPYAYGHGYVYLPGLWRTVMAYNDYCVDNGTSCTRLQYFSNPAITYGGVAMGVAGVNDNESVHENSKTAIAGLESTISNRNFNIAWTHTDGEYGDMLSFTSITNSASYVMNSGSQVNWRTGSYHVMTPGFWAKSGSKFRAYFDDCTALAPRNESASNDDKVKLPLPGGLMAQPNPFLNSFELVYNNRKGNQVIIELYSSLGQKVQDIFSGYLENAGAYKFQVDGSKLKPGIYNCVVSTNGHSESARLVKIE